jgi:lipoprotein-anchoring transpeptidase ErfK/SrfK
MSYGILDGAFATINAMLIAMSPATPATAQHQVLSATVTASPAATSTATLPATPAVMTDMVAEGDALRPGGFVWRPELASDGDVEVVVSIPQQRAYVYRAGTLIGVTTVSTGRPGHRTPTGTFRISEKHREHYSNRYNNAPMPFMQRLTNDGIALHAGHIPGTPASHGCVRLPLAMARNLFGVTRVGAQVHIVDRTPVAGQALAMVRPTAPAFTGMGGPEEPVTGTN